MRASAKVRDQVASRVAARTALLCLMNAERHKHGLRPLAENPRLREAALGHARWMVRNRYFSHFRPGGVDLVARLRAVKYIPRSGGWLVGENIGYGLPRRSSPADQVRFWMASPAHRANILNPRFRAAGLGIWSGTPRNSCPQGRHLRDRLRLAPLGDDAPVRRLLTIPISHYCEKARWALERAGLDYAEERHVQGVHILVARRAGGRETVPVLIADEGVFNESEDILRYADRHLPEERGCSRPTTAGERGGGAQPLARRGARAGRAAAHVRAHARPARSRCSGKQPGRAAPGRVARYAALWPLATRLAGRRLGLGAARTTRTTPRACYAAFDAIAERLSDGRPRLCGERFTAADLTFACLASSVLVPPEYGVRLPQPDELPEHIARDVRGFREHPAGRLRARAVPNRAPGRRVAQA